MACLIDEYASWMGHQYVNHNVINPLVRFLENIELVFFILQIKQKIDEPR